MWANYLSRYLGQLLHEISILTKWIWFFFDDPSNSFKLTVHYDLLPHLISWGYYRKRTLKKRSRMHDDFSTNSLEICADSAWHVEYQSHFQEIELDALCTMGSRSGYTFELLTKMCWGNICSIDLIPWCPWCILKWHWVLQSTEFPRALLLLYIVWFEFE